MRFQGRGLRSRIIWTTALVSLLAMGAVIGTAILALNAVTRGNVDTNLNDRFVLASEGIKDDPRGPKVALDTPLDSVEDSTWLFDGSGRQVLGPDAGRRVQGVVDDLGTVTKRTSLTKRGRVYLAGPVTIGGPDPGPGVLVVAQSLEPYDDTRTEILIGLVAMALLVTAGATGIAAWTMHRTLVPVESMASLAEDWSETDLDERFDGLGSQNEIAHLGHTLNLLLDRVAGALRGEQRLTAELAHELRTPLTGIRGEVELALMTERDPDTRARLDRVVLLVDQMSSTITTLLAIARGHGHQHNSTTVDAVLTATLTVVRRGSARSGAPHPRPVSGSAPPRTSPYARCPPWSTTRCATPMTRSPCRSVTGSGPSTSRCPTTDRVWTGRTVTRSRPAPKAPDSPWRGLGLALAQRVAHTLGGDVTLTSYRDPTSFTLTLPKP
jgi:signal transduction histidine kinase